jgi:hypothetical protein
MTVQKIIRRRVRSTFAGFIRSEAGLVTVEWVALAGSVVVGAILIGWTLLNTLGQSSAVTSQGATITKCEPKTQAGMGC